MEKLFGSDRGPDRNYIVDTCRRDWLTSDDDGRTGRRAFNEHSKGEREGRERELSFDSDMIEGEAESAAPRG